MRDLSLEHKMPADENARSGRLPRAIGAAGQPSLLSFYLVTLLLLFSSRTGLLTPLNAAKTMHLYGKV